MFKSTLRLRNSGYSTLSKSTTISQIKRDNMRYQPIKYNYIETMYRSGNFFNYEQKQPNGGYKTQLSILETNSKKLQKEVTDHKNDLFYFLHECQDVKCKVGIQCKEIKKELINKIDQVEDDYKVGFNKQKIVNQKMKREIDICQKNNKDVREMINIVKDSLEKLKRKISLEHH